MPVRAASRTRPAVVIALLAGCGCLASAPPAMAESAATAQFVSGTVTVTAADGSRSALRRGVRLDVGATILTGADGRVHLSFTDGGYVSLTPNSELRVDAYRYSGQPDGSERLALQLLKGGLRTVTGAIGKALQSAYEMATKVATIGIRGTEYTLLYLPRGGVTGTVASGRIEVCNSAGCLEVNAGNSFLVTDGNTRPALSATAADLGAPAPGGASNRLGDATSAPGLAGEWVDLSFQTVQALKDTQGPPGDPGGDPTGRIRRVGYKLIGVTAPEVDTPVRDRVSEFLHQGNHPGNGWGAGGNPSRNTPK